MQANSTSSRCFISWLIIGLNQQASQSAQQEVQEVQGLFQVGTT